MGKLTTDKDGIELQEHKGIWSLSSMRTGQDGKLYAQWAMYQTGRDKHASKDWPVKVILGDRAKAIEACLWVLKGLTGADYGPEARGQGEVPF